MNASYATDWQDQPRLSKRFWVGCAIVALSVSFVVVSIVQVFDARALAAQSVPVHATVAKTREVPPFGRTTEYTFHLHYTFAQAGQTIKNDRIVPEPLLRAHPTGTIFTLDVHPTRPRIHDHYPGETRAQIGGFFLFSVLTAVLGIWLALTGGNFKRLRTRRSAPR